MSNVKYQRPCGMRKLAKERADLYDSQNGCCAICGNPETRFPKRGRPGKHGKVFSLCFDHDPDTNTARGLLCSKCNQGIGLLQHDLDLIRKAVTYLEYYKEHPGPAIPILNQMTKSIGISIASKKRYIKLKIWTEAYKNGARDYVNWEKEYNLSQEVAK
jgi:hypothetical protein